MDRDIPLLPIDLSKDPEPPESKEGIKTLERKIKAFDFVDGWAKLVIGLATGILTLSGTFIKDIVPEGTDLMCKDLLYVSWGLLAVTVVFGCIVIQTLISELHDSSDPSINRGVIKLFSIGTCLLFVGGLASFALFVQANF